MDAIVLFAHGSRDPLWHQPMQSLQKLIEQQCPQILVRCAYLELCQPDLMTVVHDLTLQSCQSIRVIPLFLGVGKHAREDLPLLMNQLKSQYPNVAFECLPAVGEHPLLLSTLAQIATN